MKKAAPFILMLLMLLLIASCQSNLLQLRPNRGNRGEIYVYLRPFPPGLREPGLRISGIRAIGVDGADFPLKVALSDIRSEEMNRQRLLASGLVPSGLFSGIRFALETSPVKEGEGTSPVPRASEEIVAEFPFEVRPRKAVVLSGAFGLEESTEDRPRLSFTLSIPRGPLPGFAGYASNTDSGTVTVFDKRSMEVSDVIVAEGEPRGIALNQTAGRLYVAVSGGDSVEVVDTLTQASLGMVLLTPGDKPSELGISREGKTVLVANYGSDTVSFIDGPSLMETGRLRVGNGPYSVLIDAAGRLAFVFNSLSNSISVLDIGARAVIATIAVESEPLRGAFNPRGDRLYVIHKRSPYILVVDTASFATVERIYVGGGGVDALQIDRRSGLMYVAKRQESMVTVFAPSVKLPVGFIITDGAVRNMAVDDEDNRLYLAMAEKAAVAVVNLVNRRTISAIDLPDVPYAIDIMGTRGRFP